MTSNPALPAIDDDARELDAFTLTTRRHLIAGQPLDLWLVEADAKLRALEDEALHGKDASPYFGKIWPAGKALAEVLARDAAASTIAGKRVLDLGCGTGVVGLVAARLGARVTFADFMPHARALTRRNLERNGIDGDVLALDVRDVAANGSSSRFDVVAAGDMIYEPWMPPAIAGAIVHLLADGGVAFVADTMRPAAKRFPDECAARNLACAAERVVTGIDKQTFAVRVFRVQPHATAPAGSQ